MGRIPSFVRSLFAVAVLCSIAASAQRPAIQPNPPLPSNFSRGPVIGSIDYYGLRKLPQSTIEKVLNVHVGDVLPFSKGDVEQRLDEIPGVVESHLEAVCCQNGRVALYVGIEERGAAHFDLHDVPDGDAMLPQEVDLTYKRFVDAADSASRQGLTGEDLTKGYARSEDPFVRAIQDMFPALVTQYLAQLRAVLRSSGDEAQRATAAYVIGYAPEPQAVVNDLEYALRDSDPGVRVNAARSLIAFAVAGIKVEPTWFIEMLNSLSWTDRTWALKALVNLTDPKYKALDPAATLEQIRMRALPSLIEMARWKTLEHALPAYILLARAAGIPAQQANDAWSKGDRESVIAQAVKATAATAPAPK